MRPFQLVYALLLPILVNCVSAATCTERDLLGRWAFFSRGTSVGGVAANETVEVGSVGAVVMDGRGLVTTGWVATRTSFEEVNVTADISGNYSVGARCIVNVNLQASGEAWSFHGALVKGKQFIQGYANSADGGATAAYHARITSQCHFNESVLTGSFVGADIQSRKNSTQEGFLEILDCIDNNFCLWFTSSSNGDDNSNNNSKGTVVNVSASPDFACMFNFGPVGFERVAVTHDNGMYVLSNDSTTSFATGFQPGAI
jgi:hypothetical protein